MSVFTRRPYGRLAVVLNMLSSINIEIIIIIICGIFFLIVPFHDHCLLLLSHKIKLICNEFTQTWLLEFIFQVHIARFSMQYLSNT